MISVDSFNLSNLELFEAFDIVISLIFLIQSHQLSNLQMVQYQSQYQSQNAPLQYCLKVT